MALITALGVMGAATLRTTRKIRKTNGSGHHSVLAALNTMRETNELQHSAITASVESNREIIEGRLDAISERANDTNRRVSRLEDRV